MSFESRLRRGVRALVKEIRTSDESPPVPIEPAFTILEEAVPGVVYDNRLLEGMNVLVTGAGHNIGRAIALEMGSQGASIVSIEIDAQRSADLRDELDDRSISSIGFVADVTDRDQIDAVVQSLRDRGVGIDVLVNNVGREIETTGFADQLVDEWRTTFETNLFGPLHLNQEIVGDMVERGTPGVVLFITSIHENSVRQIPAYSASKAALRMIIAEMAVDLARHNIRVNGIAPGSVREDRNGRPGPHPTAPLYRTTVNPRYVGRAAVFLASNYFSKFTTGTVLRIDGGQSLLNFLFFDELAEDY